MRKQFTIFLILVFVLGLVPVNFSNASSISTRLKGRILLQVESKGEAWYVNPDNEKRHYLGRPADAFQVMRELGLGVSNKDFDSWNNNAPSRLSGKILLKVEDSGKAYYVNPVDLKMHYLGRPADAFRVMRELGLGITNSNLNEIKVSNTINEKINITDLATGVVKVDCYTGENDGHVKGSGFLVKEYNEKSRDYSYIVVTNQHVVDSPVYNECRITVIDDDNLSLGIYVFGSLLRWKYNDDSDVTFSYIDNKFAEERLESTDINKLNYKISDLPHCKEKAKISSKIYAIGFPVFSESAVSFFDNSGTTYYRIITDGIISGLDDSAKEPFGDLPYSNYFITATIDSGSSGGPVFIEESGDLCLLGILTWVSLGDYETQGVVQNIHNIYYESNN